MKSVSRLLRFWLYSPPQRKVLPVGALEALEVDAAAVEDLHLCLAEVLADDGDEVDVGEERSAQGEVGQRPAQQVVDFAIGRLDRVEGNRTDGKNGHLAENCTGYARRDGV